jgi:hypothetical protein
MWPFDIKKNLPNSNGDGNGGIRDKCPAWQRSLVWEVGRGIFEMDRTCINKPRFPENIRTDDF